MINWLVRLLSDDDAGAPSQRAREKAALRDKGVVVVQGRDEMRGVAAG
ncbi:hypothetical protein E2C01_054122 [Portunus trituberculatus]|uniref:Uncharacterized protein n=1 Tax=Portunus trituberculatus TaxID=210409 RepID=A0A5B7GRX7_PORTR|nr:hypothetical protein [Portunus trituberculatus]